MKKILLVNASPRKGGNSDLITKMLAEELKDCEVIVFNMREKKCNPCLWGMPGQGYSDVRTEGRYPKASS